MNTARLHLYPKHTIPVYFALLGYTDLPVYCARSLKELSIDLGLPYSTIRARCSDGRVIKAFGIRIALEYVEYSPELTKLLK